MPNRPPPDSAPTHSGPALAKKIWTVGTLTYTSGGVVALFAWLLFGDFAWSMRERSVMPMAQWYLNSLSVPNLVFGLLVSSFPALISIVAAPIISVKSDRHRGRWGRRIPFLLVTTPLAAFGMIGLGFTPLLARFVHGVMPEQDEMVVSLICFGVFWAAFELATIAGQSVFGGLINDIVPKELLGRFYGLFRAVSLIDGIIFNYWLMGLVPTHFTLIFVSIGVFYGTAFMVVCLKIKEGQYPPPPPVSERPVRRGKNWLNEIKGYLQDCFSSPYYLCVFILMKMGALAFAPINMFAIPYARSLGIDMSVYGKFLALTFAISFLLAFFLGWLVDLFHPLRMVMATLVGYLLLTLWSAFYVNSVESFLVAWVAHGVLSGCNVTSGASLGQRLFPKSKFAQFDSAAGIFTSLMNMMIGPAMGLVIDWSGGVYRHTFAAAAIIAGSALLTSVYVHGKFMKLGGPKHYVAP